MRLRTKKGCRRVHASLGALRALESSLPLAHLFLTARRENKGTLEILRKRKARSSFLNREARMPEFIENGGGCPLVPRNTNTRIEITPTIEWMEDNRSDQGNGIILQTNIRVLIGISAGGGRSSQRRANCTPSPPSRAWDADATRRTDTARPPRSGSRARCRRTPRRGSGGYCA